ncbi:MAG: SpoIIE family protein phosphatase [Oscillospiraceae bacterium]|nr:SpoIIE family protein phosphatase [Oscillospiraceae bacterium]
MEKLRFKTGEFTRETAFSHWIDFAKNGAVWGILTLAMELGASAFSAVPDAAALAAGLSGLGAVCAFVGGAVGALIYGFPNAMIGLGALAIVLVARIIPDLGKPKLRAAERCVAAGAAVLFSRIAETSNTAELLSVIVAALSSAIFALCVCILRDSAKLGGFDITEPRDCALGCIVTALAFSALGALDYNVMNIGRILLGFVLLALTARRGLSWCAVVGIPALLGLCAANPQIGAGGAVIAFSAAASCAFTRFGKSARAVGFVFAAAISTVITGIDEGSWRILLECAISAAAFSFVPVEKIGASEGDFSDSIVAMMLRERLNFAAEAISGIGSGISAAAETLDRRYNTNFDQIADRAADRVCRSCPNSMVCWGRKYEQFREEFGRLVTQLRTGFELTEFSLSAECAEECVNPGGVAKAITAEYSRYISAKQDEQRIREMRRIYVDQLEGIKDILRDMGNIKSDVNSVSRNKSAERRAEKLLRESGVEYPQAFVMFDRRGKLRFEAYGSSEPDIPRERLGDILEKALGRNLELPEVSAGSGRCRITATERTALSAKVGAYQIPRGKNNVCGDCYDTFTDPHGDLYIVLSDGMGTGSRARVDSAMACMVLSKLLKSGISLPAALEIVNTVMMVKSADESFATLDICKIDLNTGECAVYKAGAATTYIKSADKLVRAVLSSPPAGVGGKLSVPVQRFTVGAGDVILMMTDGVVPDEQWLSLELSKPCEPCEFSERVAKAARRSDVRDDDISVITVAVGR